MQAKRYQVSELSITPSFSFKIESVPEPKDRLFVQICVSVHHSAEEIDIQILPMWDTVYYQLRQISTPVLQWSSIFF